MADARTSHEPTLTPYVLHLMECRSLAAQRQDWGQFDEYTAEIAALTDQAEGEGGAG